MGEISVKTGNNARNGGKNSLNRLIRCVCGKKIGPDPRNFNQRVSLGRNDLLIRTFPNLNSATQQSRLLSSEHAKTGRPHLFFVTFPAGIIVAAEKYQPFVLVRTPGVKPEIVNK
ncbi:hypothetical protein [Enterobacter roggenkampii]|uniref:hypothetical protein n=1 Tax=Enterobacter roggenkampii TaxID=1812935 RepID=UPI001476F66B|nr:hypothetical protein [Enterobacter roggenkampii]